jgi:hypothetical protein
MSFEQILFGYGVIQNKLIIIIKKISAFKNSTIYGKNKFITGKITKMYNELRGKKKKKR